MSMRLMHAMVLLFVATGLHSVAFALDQSTGVKATTILKAPGAETGWHLHPANSFAVLLKGELEITLKNGASKRLKPGEALAEVANTLHNGRNVGTVPATIVVFYVGEVGQTLSVKEPTR
jgi:quercetin dioxygenase-like cupin family protein